eukprot:g32568.t1
MLCKEYKGEDTFGVAIVGFGAFAVENIRTCCEHRSGKIYLVCRRKNLCMPRMVSWWINGSIFPIASSDVLREMEDVYKMVGDDPWSYYAVHSNEARTNVTIFQKARFGIGDIYFLSRPWKGSVLPVPAKFETGTMERQRWYWEQSRRSLKPRYT